MTVATETRTDQEIQEEVLDELNWEPRLNPNEIGVSVNDAIVTLSGWVDSYLKKWDAEQAAYRVRGVKAVVNNIEVKLPGEKTDVDIAEAVVRGLEWDSAIPKDKIRVTVSKGWVTLEGQVTWQFQKSEAESIARRVSGVNGVTNLIKVEPGVTPSDLKKKIEQALVRSAQIDADRITVEVQGDKAILKGTVRSWAEREEAEREAWAAPGVLSVDNRITIKP